MTDATRELASLLLKPPTREPVRIIQGVVSSVDNFSHLSVNLSGSVFSVGGIRRFEQYTNPSVGDTIWILQNGPDLVALGKVRPDVEVAEGFHFVGTAGEPAFQNSWVNFASGHHNAGFYKDPDGVVYLVGLVKNGAATSTMFTLPAGYRPDQNLRFACMANGAITNVTVAPDGTVRQGGTGTTTNVWVNLSGICFVAEDSTIPRRTYASKWMLDSQYGGSSWAWDWNNNEAPPGVWRRDDGLCIYRGTLEGAGGQGAARQFYQPYAPYLSKMVISLIFTGASYTAHGGGRLDVDAAFGSSISINTTCDKFSLDNARWFDNTAYNTYQWNDITLQNSWVPYNSGADFKWSTPQYMKDRYGRVWVTGLIKNGTTTSGTLLFTLPVGYRPAVTNMMNARGSGGNNRIDIEPDGEARVFSTNDATTNSFLSLDAISFVPA